MSTGLVIALAIIAMAVIFLTTLYNRLVTLRNRFKNAFSQIDVQLKRRYDLIPNLVDTAKGYLAHERETLEAVVKARNIAVGAEQKAALDPSDSGAMSQLMGAESALGGALSRLMVTVEAHPELKADRTMSELTEELRSTENRIAFARQAYNDAVTGFNTEREKFPTVALAGALGFTGAALFEILDATERTAPKTGFTS